MKDSVRRADPVAAIEEAVQAARLDMVFGSQPTALAVSVVLAGITVAILSMSIAPVRLALWFCLLAGISGARALLYIRYRKERSGGLAALPIWERRFQLGCLCGGMAWGLSALIIFPDNFALQGFLAFVLAGVSSGAMAELAVAPHIGRAFIIPCAAPLALRFFLQGDGLHTAMGAMTVLYIGLTTYAMRRGQTQLKQTVAAQLDASATRRQLTETAQRVEVMKSEFVSVVSHELRTPLTAIRGALGLLAHQASVNGMLESGQQLLQVATRNAERLHLLIEDLLDIEKLESGGMSFDLKCQPVIPLITQSIAANCAYATTHCADLTMAAQPADVCAALDAGRFLQVMMNLLTNAAKFSPAGGTVTIAVLAREGRARIEVRDSGPGIPLALRPRIFGKFCQGDSSDSRAKGGTGLGLAICKAIVEQMGGRIGFETAAAGTTFFFELPTCKTAARHA